MSYWVHWALLTYLRRQLTGFVVTVWSFYIFIPLGTKYPLFALFINSITEQLLSSCRLYTDYLQIYFQATPDNLTQAVDIINQDLMRIYNYATAKYCSRDYGLSVNLTKTQVIIADSSRLQN